MTRPIRACIDLSALQKNLSTARRQAPNSKVMAVIKANAYGHGAVQVARALGDADAFAVASVEEAVTLHDADSQQPLILLEGVFEPGELQAVQDYALQMVVHTAEQVEWLELSPLRSPLHLWLKIDTGMHRLGLAPGQARALIARLDALIARRGGSLRLMSHMACADEPQHAANDTQLAEFTAIEAGARERSLANSAALLSRTDMHFDWVRPGIMLYGASPFVEPAADTPALAPVMTLESRLIAVVGRRRGEAVGYGQTWTCPEDMPVGVVAAGYGDGYPRHATSGTPVLVNGRVVPLIGRVSMDMLCVDLRSQPEARGGDTVQLWGSCLPVEGVAQRAGTISYELLCNVNARVPRVYLHG